MALLLVVVIFCTSNIVHAASANEVKQGKTVKIAGVEFILTEQDGDYVLSGDADGFHYVASIDKVSNAIHIECDKDEFLWKKDVYDYDVEVENFNKDNAILEYNLVDCETGKETHVNDSEYFEGQLPVAIYGGIALTDLIIGLLAATAVVVVGEIAYYTISDVIEDVKEESRKNKKYYYYAMVDGSQLLIGSAFKNESTALAYAKANLNSSKYGVFCIGSSRAQNLAEDCSPYFLAYYDSKHGSGDGYRAHYHPRITQNGTSHYSLHCWF